MGLSKYDLKDKLYESNLSIVYRAERKADKQPVIVKILNEEYPSKEQLIRFNYEYQLLNSFNTENVVKAYTLEKYGNSAAIIEEDFGGIPLNMYNWQLLNLASILKLFIKITDIIKEIHEQNIIHKDISPSNILWNYETDEVKIIDFGIATRLSHEKSEIINPDALEGKLAYISPEQTGRMNRTVDYRSDFYSLGATFYETLTNKQPFCDIKDEMELVYCHLAKQPIPPHEINGEIPIVISKIIQKLMSKNAENRYQSTFGLKSDLQECLNQLSGNGTIEEFELCKNDQLSKFQIPQKLYGREEDIEILMKNFTSVCDGNTEMMLISGAAGIGKSNLVNEIHKSMVKQRGYFISGKYDQFQRNIPYGAIIYAFRELINQLLTESTEKIKIWKERFLNTIGSNGNVIIDAVPKFELIIGKQKPIQNLPPTESQNRFNLVFQNFIHTIATKEHPLVIFLDDLQWADNASLNFIEILLNSQTEGYLLIIGSYRNNEVDKSHSLELTINNIKNEGILINNIKLEPLGIEHVNQLVADSLKCDLEKTRPLAELVLTKTEGNPFFINEFLRFLYEKKLIRFDYESVNWEWNLKSIQEMGITDNIVELMAGKIKDLTLNTQEVLKLAACIGNNFDLKTLAVIYEKSKTETASDLWDALQAYMILPIDDSYKYTHDLEYINPKYKFLHDRIQQAAYFLIPQDKREELHLQIGRLILGYFSKEEQIEQIFDIVSHLNLGQKLIIEKSEKIELAHLNLTAGIKAKNSTAYASAFNYIKIGIELLEKDQWEKEYDLYLKLHIEGSEIAYLNGEFEYMKQLAGVVMEKAKTAAVKAEIYDIQVRTYIAKNNPTAAIKAALQALSLLGVNIPENPSETDIGQGLMNTQAIWAEKRIEDLIKLDKMTDPNKLAAMQIISTVMPITYVAAPTLVPMLAFAMVDLSVNFGNAPASTFGYATYGLVLCGSVGDIDSGYKFGELALNLLEFLDAKEFKSRTYFYVYLFISHWKQHLRDSLSPALEAYRSGLETGDIANSTLNAMLYGHHAYIAGQELSIIADEMQEYSNIMFKLKQNFVFNYNELYRYAVLSWIKQEEDESKPFYEDYYQEMLPVLKETQNISAIWIIYLNKTIFDYVFERFTQAYEDTIEAEKYIIAATGAITPPLFYFYDSLIRLAIYSETHEISQVDIIKKVEENQEKIKKWAEYAPMNFLHKWKLVEAEKARILGKDREAEKYYDEAIDLARENEYINEEALAYELAARFYLGKNKNRIAGYYLWEAHYAYQRWGAIVKIDDLKKKYSNILSQIRMKHSNSTITTNTSPASVTVTSTLDLTSALKASQIISNEINLNFLLEKIMHVAVENAGAQIGSYISVDNGNLSVLVELTKGSKCKHLGATPINEYKSVSQGIVNYVARTFNDVVYYDASSAKENLNDEYIQKNSIKSLLSLCIRRNNQLKGILYFENNLSKGVFTKDRIDFLKMLLGQMNISLENANLYNELKQHNEKLESEVSERTKELSALNKELAENNYKLTKAYTKLEEIARTDSLTKLLNRRSMLEKLELEIENYKNNNLLFNVLILDIDNFKQFNDNYGHDCGDFVLKSVSENIKSVLRPEDYLARWGGEEFLVLLPNSQIKLAEVIAERIRSFIADFEFDFNKLRLRITLTIGVSDYRENDLSIDDVIKRADEALYLGKNSGKNKVVKF